MPDGYKENLVRGPRSGGCFTPVGPGLARRSAAFTLVEMLVVIAVLGIVAGMVVMLSSGVTEETDTQLINAECAEIRKAAQKFHADMGETPRYIAELIQTPDTSDAGSGWWWRTDGTLDSRMWQYDPATRRGWDGPYLRSDFISDGSGETVESRLVEQDRYEKATSSVSAGRQLAILMSRYKTFPQKQDGSELVSHYQLDFSDEDELAVRFVENPLADPDETNVVTRLGLGIKP